MSIVAPLLSSYMGGSWSLDQGVDISGGTPTIANKPLLAIASGTIVNHGIGGFGQWAPILKLDQPINGYQYVYYGHAGPGGQVPVGTHVNAGQAIGQVGAGIVGISTGPHLEIGFSDIRGTPISGSASIMQSLLKGATALTSPAHGGAGTVGSAVRSGFHGGTANDPISNAATAVGNVDLNPLDAISNFFNGLWTSIVSQAKYAALAFIAIMGAFFLLGRGISRTTHSEAAPA